MAGLILQIIISCYKKRKNDYSNSINWSWKICLIAGGANMKAAADEKVIVVCLNVFLAFWAKNTYASNYYDNN